MVCLSTAPDPITKICFMQTLVIPMYVLPNTFLILFSMIIFPFSTLYAENNQV